MICHSQMRVLVPSVLNEQVNQAICPVQDNLAGVRENSNLSVTCSGSKTIESIATVVYGAFAGLASQNDKLLGFSRPRC